MEAFRPARNRGSAFLFYLGYCFLIFLISVLIGGMARAVLEVPLQTSLILGNSLAVLFCMGLGFLILRSKGHLDHFGYWCVVLMGGILAFFTNGLLGMVPIAFLTTRAPAPQKQWEVNEGDWQRDEKMPLDRL